MFPWKIVRRALLLLLCAMAAYFILGSVVPNVSPRPVSRSMTEAFSASHFYGNGTGVDRAGLIESPEDAFSVRMALIDAARDQLDVVTHSIHDDDTARALLARVVEAADRGVQVRLVVDGKVGAGGNMGTVLKDMSRHGNITVYRYNPMNIARPSTWHALLHDKLVLADGQYLLCGGRNLGDRYFAPQGMNERLVAYDRDVLAVRTDMAGTSVCDEAGQYIESLLAQCDVMAASRGEGYLRTLADLGATAQRVLADNPVYTARTLADFVAETVATRAMRLIGNPVDNTRSEPTLAWQLGQLMAEAQASVLVQTPYATANKKVLAALSAVPAEVERTYLTNSMASSPNFFAFSDYYARRSRFIATGFTLLEYQGPGSIHGKSLVVDGRLSAVGSLNLDDRSIYLDTETMVVIDSEAFADKLLAATGALGARSLEVDREGAYVANPSLAPAPVGYGKRVGMGLMSVLSGIFRFLV